MLLARPARSLTALSLLAAPPIARADIDPLSGIDLVRIGSPGNAPWMGNGFPSDAAVGRGQVNYEYAIGRFEVTTSQWVEFYNAVYDRATPLGIGFIRVPQIWGAAPATPQNGGARWSVPAGNDMLPVGGISWRTAAIYCNWLCNGKSTVPSAFMNGAYDVATFGTDGDIFLDQVTHNANARYWIPTWDEQLKASHFDPNRYGPGLPGYWIANNATGQVAQPGPPGSGGANFGFTSPNPFAIPLGAYQGVQSAYGLFDTAGATSEWTETPFMSFGQMYGRRIGGSYWGSDTNASIRDTIYNIGDDRPDVSGYGYGFRVASSVPEPAVGVLLAGVLCTTTRRLRPKSHPEGPSGRRPGGA